ncbi:hypothetical protein ABE096_22840 [Robertmurraya massiliosenegalensis]|uniref:hypothetical protein n=1 Tax=Robertmurraya TaxID=2837507 RepID=UPI0039A561C2
MASHSGKYYIVQELVKVFEIESKRAEEILDMALVDHEVRCQILNFASDYLSDNPMDFYRSFGIKLHHLL